ncbi:hypothetical protein H311_00354 [Anncaliia algerae PRA109]|nr:hypothetical protein H311_00354 [Anncaliia algerae PRA109]
MLNEELSNIFNEILNKIGNNCFVCNSKTKIYRKTLYKRKCTWKKCSKNFSLLENTLFNSSKIPLIKKLLIIKLWCTKIKLSAISETTKTSKQSISKVMKRLY